MTYSERLYIMESKQRARERKEKETQEEIKKMQKEQAREKEKKEYEKDIFLACYYDVKNSFDKVFEKADLKNKMELDVLVAQFYNVETRKKYMRMFGENLAQQDYIDKIYDKTLKEVYNKWKNHLQYLELQQIKEESKKQEEISNSTAFKIIMSIVFVCIILGLLIKFALIAGIILAIIIFLVILGCAIK